MATVICFIFISDHMKFQDLFKGDRKSLSMLNECNVTGDKYVVGY